MIESWGQLDLGRNLDNQLNPYSNIYSLLLHIGTYPPLLTFYNSYSWTLDLVTYLYDVQYLWPGFAYTRLPWEGWTWWKRG